MSILGGAVALLGAVLILVAAVALHRFDTVMARLHAAGKATSLGITAVLVGLAVHQRDGTSPRLVLAAVFYMLTVAAAVDLLARTLHRGGDDR